MAKIYIKSRRKFLRRNLITTTPLYSAAQVCVKMSLRACRFYVCFIRPAPFFSFFSPLLSFFFSSLFAHHVPFRNDAYMADLLPCEPPIQLLLKKNKLTLLSSHTRTHTTPQIQFYKNCSPYSAHQGWRQKEPQIGRSCFHKSDKGASWLCACMARVGQTF